jgi:peptidoglycan/LPS O-acetylase OafA/YrhL
MALNRKFNLGPDEDELDALREKHAVLQREKEALQKQVKALQEKLKAPKPQKPPKRSSIFLILAAFMVIARLVLYIVVEDWGTRASNIGLGLSGILGFAVLCMIIFWAFNDQRTDGWIVAGASIFLLVAILICASIFDPVLMETGEPGPVQRPVIAAAALISCLLFAATGMTRWIMGWLLLLVSDPKRIFQR